VKLSRAHEGDVKKNFIEAELMRSPSNHKEWFIMLHKRIGKSYMLLNDDDSVIVSSDIDQLLSIIKSLDLRQVIVNI